MRTYRSYVLIAHLPASLHNADGPFHALHRFWQVGFKQLNILLVLDLPDAHPGFKLTMIKNALDGIKTDMPACKILRRMGR